MSNVAVQTYPEPTFADTSVGTSMVAYSRDEMNLAEFPLAVLATRVNPNIKTLEFSDTTKSVTGELIKRDWIITGANKFGLPTSTDDDVILGLICLSKQGEFKERKVYFTRYELLKILQWTTEGRSYTRLTKSLDRLSGLRIKASNAFYDNASTAYLTKNFGIIDAYELKDERANAKNPNSFFIWSEAMFNSFKAGYIRRINLGFYFALNSAVARRLYRYLDKYFYYNPVIKKPLMMFAFEKLGLSRTYKYVSSIKQQIVPACNELVEKGFLESFEFSGHGENTMIHFVKKSEKEAVARSVAPQNITAPDTATQNVVAQNITTQNIPAQKEAPNGTINGVIGSIASQLVERGLSVGQAKKLLNSRSEGEIGRISDIIEYFDTLVSAQDPKISRNKVGFLYRAVENPEMFKLPSDYMASSKRQHGRCHVVVTNGDARSYAKDAPPLRKISKLDAIARGDRLKQSAYEQYRTCMVDAYKRNISEDVILEVQATVETKVKYLKTILGQKSYIEARDGLVKQELATMAGVVSFEEWEKIVGQ